LLSESSLATSAAFGLLLVLPSRARSANERLNIGGIGGGGRGATDLAAVAGEKVVAWCDSDVGRLNTAGPGLHPNRVAAQGCLSNGKSLEYDPATMKVTNLPDSNSLLTKNYRQGWI
jgi:hypothetical protein